MTAKLSISLPDDVAEWLGGQSNVSATVTEVLRAHIRAKRTEEILRLAGFDITDAGKKRWRGRLSQSIPAHALAEGREMLGRRDPTS